MTIPFTKAHGAGNDFLLTWAKSAPGSDLPALARAICHRHTGIGADGWMLVDERSIRLFNTDGTEPEISGNGTRCAAALLVDAGLAGTELTIATGAGDKRLRLLERHGKRFLFEMDMGLPSYTEPELRTSLSLDAETIIEAAAVYVGNPQAAIFVTDFPLNWKEIGAAVEAHPHFPRRTNVSFVKVVDPHALEVRFFERGVGPTASSGTGSTGAAVAAILRGVVDSPVRVITGSGDLHLRWDDSVYLTGPAEIAGHGEFYWE